MANTKSAIKRVRRISKQTAVNKARKSRYKNALKKMNLLIDGKKKSEALKFLIPTRMCTERLASQPFDEAKHLKPARLYTKAIPRIKNLSNNYSKQSRVCSKTTKIHNIFKNNANGSRVSVKNTLKSIKKTQQSQKDEHETSVGPTKTHKKHLKPTRISSQI